MSEAHPSDLGRPVLAASALAPRALSARSRHQSRAFESGHCNFSFPHLFHDVFQPDAVPTELTHHLTALPLLATPNAARPNLYMLLFCSTGSQAAPVDKKAPKRLRFQ